MQREWSLLFKTHTIKLKELYICGARVVDTVLGKYNLRNTSAALIFKTASHLQFIRAQPFKSCKFTILIEWDYIYLLFIFSCLK